MLKISPASREWAALALLLLLGLAPRLAFVKAFPVLPVSDFRALLDFGLLMRDRSLAADGFQWTLFSPGLPLVLSVILRIFPGSPETVARLATAVVSGLVPILPFTLWRGVLPLWVRLLAGALLALWPGQIAFSGVVAQDNWVLVPTVALGALAARSLIAPGRSSPVMAGLLYALGVAMRQEMLVVLLPLLFAGAGFASRAGWRWRRIAACALAAGLPLLLLATQRRLATGRFALTSGHSGPAILGSYIPGATANAWADPAPYVASVEPALLKDVEEFRRQGTRLAVREALRRPVFHTARILAYTANFLLASETGNFYWSLLAPDALPPERQELAGAFAGRVVRLLRTELAIIQTLFLAAVLLGLRRNPAVLVLCAAIALKVALHAVTVAQGRYFLAVTALQMLVIALGCWEARRRSSRAVAAALAAAAVAVLSLLIFTPRAVAEVQARDVDVQRTYRFTLDAEGGGGTLDCTIGQGRLAAITLNVEAILETFHPNPGPGEKATAACRLTGTGIPVLLALRIFDPYASGGSAARMVQRVRVDGRVVFSHDVAAEPGSGWSEIPLGNVGAGTARTIAVELVAIQPDPGISWGREARTAFRLSQARRRP